MSASLDTKKTLKAKTIIDDALEPKIKKLIEEANRLLNKQGIQVGCEIQWFLDVYKQEENEDEQD